MAKILMFRRPNLEAQRGPLLYPDDTPALRKLIKELIELKYFVSRPSKHHIKHGAINFYPSTGTITIDAVGRHPENGRQAFLALLKTMYPKQPVADWSGGEPPPRPVVLKIDLDDQEEATGDQEHKQDDDGDLPW